MNIIKFKLKLGTSSLMELYLKSDYHPKCVFVLWILRYNKIDLNVQFIFNNRNFILLFNEKIKKHKFIYKITCIYLKNIFRFISWQTKLDVFNKDKVTSFTLILLLFFFTDRMCCFWLSYKIFKVNYQKDLTSLKYIFLKSRFDHQVVGLPLK